MKTFDLIVEGKSEDVTKIARPELELFNLNWNGESPPDIIILPKGLMLVKVGRYAAAGNRYRYRVATVSKLVEGNLQSKED